VDIQGNQEIICQKLVGHKDYDNFIKVKNGKVVKAAINLQLAD
jgi:hypothetical protein